MTTSIADLVKHINKNLSDSTVVSGETTPNLSLLSITAKKKSKRPLSKLQYMLLLIIKEDCRIQKYCDRSIEEFQNLSGHSRDGVRKALKVLNDQKLIFTKKQTRGYNSVRAISREGLIYKRISKKAPQKAPQTKPILYNISSPEHDNADLLARDLIFKTTRREEECFRALEFKELDELLVLSRIKSCHLTQEERFTLANTIMAANYKRPIQYKRAYYLAAIDNAKRDF